MSFTRRCGEPISTEIIIELAGADHEGRPLRTRHVFTHPEGQMPLMGLGVTTVHLRTKRSRNCGSRDTTLAMVFKLLQTAHKRWRRIKHFQRLELVVSNFKFQDSEQVANQSDRNAA